MSKGHACNRCDFIFPHEDAAEEPLEFRYGGPGIRFLCPHCFSRDIEEIVVCPECQSERLAKGEDLGKNCLAAEEDALVEMQLDQFDERTAARSWDSRLAHRLDSTSTSKIRLSSMMPMWNCTARLTAQTLIRKAIQRARSRCSVSLRRKEFYEYGTIATR